MLTISLLMLWEDEGSPKLPCGATKKVNFNEIPLGTGSPSTVAQNVSRNAPSNRNPPLLVINLTLPSIQIVGPRPRRV